MVPLHIRRFASFNMTCDKAVMMTVVVTVLLPEFARVSAMSSIEKLDLKEYVASSEKKQTYVNRLFNTIAHRYDFFTAAMSFGMDRGWKRKLIEMAELEGKELILDLACGTGDITFLAASRLDNGWAVGLDITQPMLNIAEKKRVELGKNHVSFHRGDMMNLPFEDSVFDRVTGGYALRNVPEIRCGLHEIYRVLKPGGRLFSLDFGHPSNGLYRRAYFNYLSITGSIVGYLLHRDPDTYRYIPETLKLYPGQRGVKKLMEEHGFVDTGFHDFGGGIMAINYGTKPR